MVHVVNEFIILVQTWRSKTTTDQYFWTSLFYYRKKFTSWFFCNLKVRSKTYFQILVPPFTLWPCFSTDTTLSSTTMVFVNRRQRHRTDSVLLYNFVSRVRSVTRTSSGMVVLSLLFLDFHSSSVSTWVTGEGSSTLLDTDGTTRTSSLLFFIFYVKGTFRTRIDEGTSNRRVYMYRPTRFLRVLDLSRLRVVLERPSPE